MTIAQMFVAYAMTWWLVFFMVLPIGTPKLSDSDGVGYAGAPETRSLKKHYLAATVISALLMGGLYWMVEVSGWKIV